VEKEMNDKEVLDLIHINLHAVRLLPNYKASLFEGKVSFVITEHYASSCKECAERLIVLKNPPKNKNFISKLGDAFSK
jgi:hypothetical protein